MEYNIYCDESCHLKNDKSSIMVLGGISCPKDKVKIISDQIRSIKKKHGVFEFAEIKWTKVSSSKISMYIDLIDMFFNQDFLTFRAVVATNKQSLNYKEFGLTHDDWYQRIYYLLLRQMVNTDSKFSIYVDIKDTKGDEKMNTLRTILNNSLKDFFYETIQRIQLVVSHQIQILQLADLLIGAVSYANRYLTKNEAKMELIKKIELHIKQRITSKTELGEKKFNIFIWEPRRVNK